jgi:hypothetical protein
MAENVLLLDQMLVQKTQHRCTLTIGHTFNTNGVDLAGVNAVAPA